MPTADRHRACRDAMAYKAETNHHATASRPCMQTVNSLSRLPA